jgi:cytochrome d ubiquinol oxidase subunit II
MTLEYLLGASILISLIFYVLLAGADYGGGVWDLLASGKDAEVQKTIIAGAMGPVWEANHVWLILVLVVMFTAFPPAIARLSIIFHIPLTIALVGIVLRGCAFTFRHYHGHGDSHTAGEIETRWGRVFAIASLMTPVLLGTVVGGIYAGRASADAGFVRGWFAAFPVAVGIFALSLFAYLAAVYLTVESVDHPGVQEAFRIKALRSSVVTIAAGIAVLLLSQNAKLAETHALAHWIWPLRAVTCTLAIIALLAVIKRYFRAAQILVILQVTFIMAGWGAGQYPYLVPPDISIYSAAAPHTTLQALTVALAGGALILFPSFYYLFYVFKGQVLSSAKH